MALGITTIELHITVYSILHSLYTLQYYFLYILHYIYYICIVHWYTLCTHMTKPTTSSSDCNQLERLHFTTSTPLKQTRRWMGTPLQVKDINSPSPTESQAKIENGIHSPPSSTSPLAFLHQETNDWQYSLGTTEHRPRKAITNLHRTLPHPYNRSILMQFLLHLRNPFILAPPPPISSLHLPILDSTNIRRFKGKKFLSPFSPNLVNLRLIFPRLSPPWSRTTPNKEIYFRIPSSRHNISRSLRSLRYRSTRILEIIPRNHEHVTYARLKLSHSVLSRVCACHGVSECFERIVREPFI